MATSSITPHPSHSAPITSHPINSQPANIVEDVDQLTIFQELISDSLKVSTVATTKMIRVMAEVFTQQQQITNLQLENQGLLKENRELLKSNHELLQQVNTSNQTNNELLQRVGLSNQTSYELQKTNHDLLHQVNSSNQKLLAKECHHHHLQSSTPLELKKEVQEVTKKRSPTPAPRRRREKTAPPRERREKTEPPPKKRKFFNGPFCDQLSALLEALIAFKDSEGRQLSADFIQLPSRRSLPDYYKIVTQPIDFSRIRRNLKKGFYDTIDALGSDIKLLCSNCQLFNRDDSEIYRDSETLLAIWERLQASATAMI